MLFQSPPAWTKIHANRFQPGACESLVLAWLGAMAKGEGELWCERASREKESSVFYAGHLARNNLINGRGRVDSIRSLHKQATALAGELLAQQPTPLHAHSGTIETVLRSVNPGFRPAYDSAMNRLFEQKSFVLLGWRVVQIHKTDAKARLTEAANRLAPHPRFYMVVVDAGPAYHAVGFVSSRSQGYLGKSGSLFSYDPNGRCMVRYDTRAAFHADLQYVLDGFKSVVSLVELARA